MTTASHPLDRPIWNALRTRHAHLAQGDPLALRYRPAVHLFAAAADDSAASLSALAGLASPGGTLGLVEAQAGPVPSGLTIRSRTEIDQMMLTTLSSNGTEDMIERLSDAEAPDMFALATLTAPGPFFAETHRMGSYHGIRHAGALVAMAGERTTMPGFTEVSAVCTHPDHRGHGFARMLMQVVIAQILARGDAAFLHVYPDNAGAIALYTALGFRFRHRMTYTILDRNRSDPAISGSCNER